jgi:hypothetical protein
MFSIFISCLSFPLLTFLFGFCTILGLAFRRRFSFPSLISLEQQTFDSHGTHKLPSHIFTNNSLYMCSSAIIPMTFTATSLALSTY